MHLIAAIDKVCVKNEGNTFNKAQDGADIASVFTSTSSAAQVALVELNGSIASHEGNWLSITFT